MSIPLAIGYIFFGALLVATRNWSAKFHERWNQKLSWTKWATGPKAMLASKIANVVVGLGLIVLGFVWLAWK